jgi:predicted DNA-binding transcriptional regulator AlpA
MSNIPKFHSEVDPPGVLQARLQALEERITERVLEGIRKENRRLIEEQKTLKPLLSIKDVAETLSKSKRWCETALRAGELPAPLWIGGTRRWHPDTLDAYIRRSAGRRGGR